MPEQYQRAFCVTIILVKLLVLGSIALVYFQIPYCDPCREQNFLAEPELPRRLASAYQTWDAQHYLYLANEGYAPGQASNAFYPLWPGLIRLTQPLFFNNSLAAALVLANLLSLAALLLFYRLGCRLTTPKTAFAAGLLLLAFPGSFYFHLAYTESLFLLLAVGAFYAAYQQRYLWLLLCLFLLPLTRANGLFVLLPLLYLVLWVTPNSGTEAWATKLKWATLMILASSAGFGTYLGVMAAATGSPWAGFEAQSFFFSNYRVSNLLDPVTWVRTNFIDIQFTFHSFNTSLLNRLFFLIYLIWLIPTWRQTPHPLFLYALLMGGITALSGELDSFPRYLIVIFPLFLALGRIWPRHPERLAIPMALLQFMFLMVHSQNYWFA